MEHLSRVLGLCGHLLIALHKLFFEISQTLKVVKIKLISAMKLNLPVLVNGVSILQVANPQNSDSYLSLSHL